MQKKKEYSRKDYRTKLTTPFSRFFLSLKEKLHKGVLLEKKPTPISSSSEKNECLPKA